MGFPKLGVPFSGVPGIRTIVFLRLYWVGNYHMNKHRNMSGGDPSILARSAGTKTRSTGSAVRGSADAAAVVIVTRRIPVIATVAKQ